MHPQTQARMELEPVSPPASESVKRYVAETVYSEGTIFKNFAGFARETGDAQIMQDLLAVSQVMVEIVDAQIAPDDMLKRTFSAIQALETSAEKQGLWIPWYFKNLLKHGPKPTYGHIFKTTSRWIERHARDLIKEMGPASAPPESSARRRVRRVK